MIHIFVEGDADQKFIEDYLKILFPEGSPQEVDINPTRGWTHLKNDEILNPIRRAAANDEKTLVIFDADNDYEDRRNEILKIKEENDLDFDLFLFPNNQDIGDLESLLEQIINPKNAEIFQAWDEYENNLSQIEIEGRTPPPLTTPAKKTKIYAYLEALLPGSKSQKEFLKEKKRKYTNPEHWDLNAEYLTPLKDFLETHLK
jgi:hypothetical protein